MKTKYRKNPEIFPYIDNKTGIGVTPLNKEVSTLGIKAYLIPKTFLLLAEPLPNEISRSEEFLTENLLSGKKFASPVLTIIIPINWIKGEFDLIPIVDRHQGRNRMYVINKLFGNIYVETHLFFRLGKSKNDKNAGIIESDISRFLKRNKLITLLNEKIINEKGKLINGPWFNL